MLYNDIVLSNNDGLNLYMGNGPEANGTWCAIPWFPVDNNTQDEYKLNQRARREALDYIRTHPLQTLTLMPKKLIALFSHGDGVFWNIISTRSKLISTRPVLRRLDQVNTIYEIIIFDLLIASLFFGCWKRLRLGKGHGWPLLGIVVMFYFISIYLVYYGAVSLSNNSMGDNVLCRFALLSLCKTCAWKHLDCRWKRSLMVWLSGCISWGGSVCQA